MNNHSGVATVYDSSGKAAPLVVTVPAGSGAGPSSVTGQVFNGGTGFVLQGAKPAAFLFCTEDGTISGWYNGIENNKAVIAVNRSGSGAVYKGLALGTSDTGPVLYAANFASGAIDVFGADFAPRTLAGTFADPALPAGFAPFNVYVTAGKIYVAYAKQDDEKEDDVPGKGNGFIDVFDANGRLTQRLVSGGHLNSPWGMVISRENFGDFSNSLLVGNFGDGTINAYNPSTGEFLGTCRIRRANRSSTPDCGRFNLVTETRPGTRSPSTSPRGSRAPPVTPSSRMVFSASYRPRRSSRLARCSTRLDSRK